MKQTIDTASQFRDAFRAMGRHDQFSHEALGLLFDYLEEIDPDMELDVIAICCEYAESTPSEILENYNFKLNEEDKDKALSIAMDYLQDNATVIGVTDSDTIVYQQF